MSNSSEKKKFEIKSLDEALELIEALDGFFKKIENALNKWHRLAGRKPKVGLSYGIGLGRSGNIEKMIEEMIYSTLEDKLREIVEQKVEEKLTTTEVKISEEEVDKIVDKVMKELEREKQLEKTSK